MITSEARSYVEYAGNNSTTTAYTITFTYQNTADIDVYVDGVAYTTWAITNTTELRTTTAIAATSVVRIERDQGYTQTQDLVANGDLPSAATETSWDKFVLLTHQIRDTFQRCLRVSRASTETEPAEMAATADHYMYIDASGDLVSRTKAQIASDVSAELSLPSNLDRPTVTTADDSSRAALAPAFTGQVLVQLDNFSVWAGNGLTAGDWELTGDAVRTFATRALLLASTPDYAHQWAAVVPTFGTGAVSWWRSYGITSGDWEFASYGDFTPPTETAWIASTAYVAGDLVRVPNSTLLTGACPSNGTATTLVLASGHGLADDDLIGCRVTLTSGTGSPRLANRPYRYISDFDAGTDTITITPDWVTNPAGPADTNYEVMWESDYIIYECLADHTSDAQFPIDLNNALWAPYVVEDYHFTRKGGVGAGDRPHEITMGPADRADDWSKILDHCWGLLPAQGGGANVPIQWYDMTSTAGIINWSDGTYRFSRPIKWMPLSGMRGPIGAVNHDHVLMSARQGDIVLHGGSTYWCKKAHEASAAGTGAGTNEPGVGDDEATYWGLLAAWANSTGYVVGDMVTNAGDTYRCIVAHTSATGTNEPQEGVAVTSGMTWYRFWQKIDHALPASAWVARTGAAGTGTFYGTGSDLDRDFFFVDGIQRGTDGSAHSNFYQFWENLPVDANGYANGMRVSLSQNGWMRDTQVDRFWNIGIYSTSGGDSHKYDSVGVQKLIAPNQASRFGFWVQDGISQRFDNPQVARCEVAMSFGAQEDLSVRQLECEHCAKMFEFREDGHLDIYGNSPSPSSQFSGEPFGCTISGTFSRDATDTYVFSDETMAFVRYNNSGGTNRSGALRIIGTSKDLKGTNLHCDRIEAQLLSGTKVTFPLIFENGYNLSTRKRVGFDWSADYALQNQRFSSLNTQTADSRLLASNSMVAASPVTSTSAVDTDIALGPGLYKIEIRGTGSGQDYGSANHEVSVYTSDDGSNVAIPDMTSIRANASNVTAYHWHTGGSMRVAKAAGTGACDIVVWIAPWKEIENGGFVTY